MTGITEHELHRRCEESARERDAKIAEERRAFGASQTESTPAGKDVSIGKRWWVAIGAVVSVAIIVAVAMGDGAGNVQSAHRARGITIEKTPSMQAMDAKQTYQACIEHYKERDGVDYSRQPQEGKCAQQFAVYEAKRQQADVANKAYHQRKNAGKSATSRLDSMTERQIDEMLAKSDFVGACMDVAGAGSYQYCNGKWGSFGRPIFNRMYDAGYRY